MTALSSPRIRLGALVALMTLLACEAAADTRPHENGTWVGPLQRLAPEFELGGPAPDFQLIPVADFPADLGAQHLADLQGNVVFLDFWGAWCSGCIKEHQMLVELASEYRERGVRFLGITADDPGAVREFEELRGPFSYPLLSDDGAIAASYQVLGWPTKVIIARDGSIAWWRPGGPLPREVIAQALDAVLEGRRPDPGPRAAYPVETGLER